MKKIFLTMSLAAAAMNINAQLVVDSVGRVGIRTGNQTLSSTLTLKNNVNDDTVIYSNVSGKKYGIYYRNFSSDSDSTLSYGYYSYVINRAHTPYGGKFVAIGSDNANTTQYVIGMAGCASKGQNAVGLWGRPDTTPSSNMNFAGVYGSETTSFLSFSNYPGTYAGFFRGKVRVTNGIYATVLSPSSSPSPSGQNGTTILSDRGESVTDKLSQVQAVQFLRYDPTQEANTSKASPKDINTDNMTPEELDSLAETMGDIEPERYLSPVQYGLDADQLKEVYPELVYEDANGIVSINYVEMVPLLVQSIKELSARVVELEGTSPRTAKTPTDATAIEESVADIDMVRMDQNKPNPFSESTVISLNIPSNAQVASIFIYDMSGKQVQSLPVSERGETNITVYAADLAAGMYIYTLVVDGKVAVTRRMIVTI